MSEFVQTVLLPFKFVEWPVLWSVFTCVYI